MASIKQFEELEVWQMARELVNEIYAITKEGKFSKDYSLKDQIRRSSVSVMNNISEGFESRTVKLFIDYLGRAKASCGETRSILYVALDCSYISQEQFTELARLAKNVSGKIQNLIRYLEGYKSNNRVEDVLIKYSAK